MITDKNRLFPKENRTDRFTQESIIIKVFGNFKNKRKMYLRNLGMYGYLF